jgi:hypothetical protein
MNNIPLIEKKEERKAPGKTKFLAVSILFLLNACTTLPHQVNKQYSNLSAALTNERTLTLTTDRNARQLAAHAQASLEQNSTQNLKQVEADLVKIQSILSERAPAANAQKQTDLALSSLDRTATSAAKLAQKERQDSSYFGIPGLISYAGQVFKNSLILVLLLAGICAALYVASFFFPVLGPIMTAAESVLKAAITRIQSLKR